MKDSSARNVAGKDELHFNTGFAGGLARFFSFMRTTRDPFEETVIAPVLVFIVTMRLAENQAVGGTAVASIILATGFLAGAFLGTVWDDRRMLRAFTRGAFVGLLSVAVATATATFPIEEQKTTALSATVTLAMMETFGFGYVVVSFIKEIALTSEQQWRKQREFRRTTRFWIGQVFEMTLVPKKLESATRPQMVVVRLLHAIGIGLGIWITGSAVFGVEPGHAIQFVTHFLGM